MKPLTPGAVSGQAQQLPNFRLQTISVTRNQCANHRSIPSTSSQPEMRAIRARSRIVPTASRVAYQMSFNRRTSDESRNAAFAVCVSTMASGFQKPNSSALVALAKSARPYFFFAIAVLGATYGSLSAGKFALRYSMKASRSPGSTTAPHLIILSTSFVHAAFPNRCCTTMPEPWHSRHAVFILDCSGPGGKSADCADTATHVSDRSKANNTLSLDMDLHPVNDVDEISAGVPLHRIRLHAPLCIGSARHDRVSARLWGVPGITP